MPVHPFPNASAGAADGLEFSRDWAQSGVMALTGQRGGPPVLPPGSAATLARRLSTYIDAAGALGGRPVRLDGAKLLSERAAFTGHRPSGRISLGGTCRLLPTADGWAAVSCAREDDPSLLGALVEQKLGDDPWPEVSGWLLRHLGRELAERAELLGIAAAPLAEPGDSGAGPWLDHTVFSRPPRPVADLLVVDFSSLWAGPLCAHLLSLAGARVVKVETPQRPDGARRGNAEFYRLLHAGHASVVLDPETPGGRAALARLVEQADIVIEASRPRALARFGLDADAAAAAGRTWISITANGRASDRVGFGDDVAAGSGLVAVDPGGLPLFVGDALADPLTGLAAAALAMTAPVAGRGILHDVAMSRVVASTLPAAPRVESAGAGYPIESKYPGAVRTAVVRTAAGRWLLDTGSGSYPIEEPAGRKVVGDAPASGADTATVLRSLGIGVP
ncbi:CoA transferase [Arthrobacter sp. MMS18-M83]|uniref:CoA transferase n=1 Tax=Arthrobacter sp. MMS18-M83 TaxID=2996261 RepID=UPI00227AE36D|nr:CoA transferase [Arthrobacter sp. MMS18-M83]WAH97710.1 CoA transferase [Arthrobacter sp. MMS18-M83]